MTLRMALGHGPVLQVSVDKGIEVAVEHAVHVRRLLAGAVIFDELVRVEDVGPDLGSPLDLGLLPALRCYLLLPLLPLQFEEPRPQYAHGYLAVLVLAPLILALRHDARGEVRAPDRGIRLVDVLPTRPGGPIRIHLEVLLFDLALDRLAHDGRDGDGGEAGVPPPAGVEGTDPDEAVHPTLGGQKPERVLPRDGKGGAFDAGFLSLGVLDDLQLEAPPLRPAPVHTREHLGPIL